MTVQYRLPALLLCGCLLLGMQPALATCCRLPAGWLELTAEQANDHEMPLVKHVAIDLNPENIPSGQPFAFDLKLCGGTDEIERVSADAIMPAHLHGMNYTPEVSRKTAAGEYHVDGFLFHMPGVWKITVSVYTGQQVSHFSTDVTLD